MRTVAGETKKGERGKEESRSMWRRRENDVFFFN